MHKPIMKLTIIKIIHTLIWIFFNVVIFYLLYAVIINKIDKWVWMGVGNDSTGGNCTTNLRNEMSAYLNRPKIFRFIKN